MSRAGVSNPSPQELPSSRFWMYQFSTHLNQMNDSLPGLCQTWLPLWRGNSIICFKCVGTGIYLKPAGQQLSRTRTRDSAPCFWDTTNLLCHCGWVSTSAWSSYYFIQPGAQQHCFYIWFLHIGTLLCATQSVSNHSRFPLKVCFTHRELSFRRKSFVWSPWKTAGLRLKLNLKLMFCVFFYSSIPDEESCLLSIYTEDLNVKRPLLTPPLTDSAILQLTSVL